MKALKNIYLKNKMKIGVIGISGKGKSTLLNHLIDEEISVQLNDLIGPEDKELEMSGQTKNPVRYIISKNQEIPLFKVSKVENESIIETQIELIEVAQYAQLKEKCTVIINVKPSSQFETVMDSFNLTELEFIDTQGLLDSLDEEVTVPYEIKACSVLLYLYNLKDPAAARGDFIEKYRNFLNSISEKPLIFLETHTPWQIKPEDLKNLEENSNDKLKELDALYSIPANKIRNRYSVLTKNDTYKNNDTFILNSILNASESSVNFYQIQLPTGYEYAFDLCLNIGSSHVMNQVFNRLSNLKQSLEIEFEKAKGEFEHRTSFEVCYGLLNDIFICEYQRITYNSSAKVLRHARNKYQQFKFALEALNNGELFNIDFSKSTREIYTEYGYYCVYETYNNQKLLDCMQLLLDLYKAYLRNISISGNKLSKAVQVYLANSISNDFMCRDTGYDIPILKEYVFVKAINELEKWVGDIPVQNVVYKNYDNFDVDYYSKDATIKEVKKYVADPKSLISKMDYLSMIINNTMYNLASDAILNTTSDFLEIK